MATSWILGKISDALQPTIHSTVSSAGSFAGGALNTVGSGINGVGETINGTIRRYGDGVRDYGNGVMDWTSATGSRAQTAGNPLGLSGGKSQGKRSVTSPSIYSAPPKPKPNPSKTLMTTNKTAQPQKKIEGAPIKKALPAPAPKTGVQAKKVTSTPAKPSPVSKGPNPGAFRSGANPVVKPASSVNQGAMKKPTSTRGLPAPSKTTAPVKASTASTIKTKPASAPKPDLVAAANPLGLR